MRIYAIVKASIQFCLPLKVLLKSCQSEAAAERMKRQKISERYMKTINELSSELESQSKLRVEEAERNEQLKNSLRARLQLYAKAEEDFNTQMMECEAALEAVRARKKYDSDNQEPIGDEEKKKRRRNKKKKASKDQHVTSDVSETPAEDKPAESNQCPPADRLDDGPSRESDAMEQQRENEEVRTYNLSLFLNAK